MNSYRINGGRPFQSWIAMGILGLLAAGCPQKEVPQEAADLVPQGEGLLRQGQVKKAEALFRKALIKEPDQGKANLGLARALMVQGRHVEAEKVLGTVARSTPNDANIIWLRAKALAGAGKVAESAKALAAALALAPEQQVIYQELARVQLKLAKPAAAAEVIRRAVLLWPNRAPLYRQLALCLEAIGEFKAGVGALNMTLALVKRNPRDLLLLARLSKKAGRTEEAESLEQEAAALDRNASKSALDPVQAARTGKGDATKSAALSPELSTKFAVAKGEELQGNLDRAAAAYREVLSQAPGAGEAYMGLGRVLVRKGTVSQAVGMFIKAMSLNQAHTGEVAQEAAGLYREGRKDGAAQLYLQVGKVWLAHGAYDKALKALEEAGRAEVDHATVELIKGEVFYKLGRYPEAERLLEALTRKRSWDGMAHYWLGLVHEKQGHMKQAARAMSRAVELRPKMAEARAASKRLKGEGRRVDRVEADLVKALVREPGVAKHYVDLYMLLADQGKTEEAESVINRVMAAKKPKPDLLLRLGESLAIVGQFKPAEAVLGRAMKLRPGDTALMLALGQVWQKMGRAAEAVSLLRKASAKKPQDVKILLSLADMVRSTGKHQQAAKLYNRIIKLDPEGSDAHRGLGLCLHQVGKYEAAVRALDRASRLKSSDNEIRVDHAISLAQLGKIEGAKKILIKVLANRPLDLGFVARVANAMLENGHTRLALQIFSRPAQDQEQRTYLLCGLVLVHRILKNSGKAAAALSAIATLNPIFHAECDGWLKRTGG